MSRLDRLNSTLRSLLRAPVHDDFYGQAKHGRHVPAAEIAVVEAALVDGGPIATRLIRQLQEAPDVYRLWSPSGAYELRVSTRILIRDVPRQGWSSRWIQVESASPARLLEMRIQVDRSGVIGLAGRTNDGQPWPRTWSATDDALAAIRGNAPWLRLPTIAEIRAERARVAEAIGGWLGDSMLLRSRRGLLRCDPPASGEAIQALQVREQVSLPRDYVELIAVADGLEVGTLAILGTADAYRLDIPGPPRLVICPPDENGAMALDEGGQVVAIDIDDPSARGRVVATDLRAWVRRRLRLPMSSLTPSGGGSDPSN
jgi:hypothetical protein